MSEFFHCVNCPGRHFSTLLEAVKHVMSERGTEKGSRGVHVQCCIQECSKRVRKLRLHIRKAHKRFCPVQCPDCPGKFVAQNDLNNHLINGCPRRKHINYQVTTPGSLIGCQNFDSIDGIWKLRHPHCLYPVKAEVCGFPTINYPSASALSVEHSKLAKTYNFTDYCQLPRNANETFFENVDFSDSSAVNKFITKELQLDEACRDEVSRVVDELYKHLQDKSTFSINQLVKGGSFGKGTAVKDKADIDCVVFLNNVKTMRDHKRKLQTIKDDLESCLKQSPFKDQITFDGQTPFAVKFKLRLNSSREFNIDLLPTFTTDLKREQLYKEMIGCETKDRSYYSAHFVNLQKEFVKEQPSIVKNLIRLVKYWRKTCIEDKSASKTRLPSSYPLELITIACWEKAGKPFDIRAGFKAVLEKLVDNCHIHYFWYKYYNKALAEKGIKGMKMDESLPFVLDPANPTNNVCSASDVKGWKIVAEVAKMTLQRQPLKEIK